MGNVNTMTYNISTSLACTVSNNTAAMNFNGSAQKVIFTFNPKQGFNLNYGDSSDSFVV